MFILAIAQWLIDIHLLVAEVEMARLSTSNDSLSNDYAAALSSTLRLMSVKDILYYYMVRLLPLSTMHILTISP